MHYDKTLESRLRNKRFMGPIWRTAGWDGSASVIRHEARLRHNAVRTLGLPADIQDSLDDPWVLLEHLPEVWGYVVGQVPHAEDASTRCAATAPPVDVAWIRRVVPDADSNRSRWSTDPVWRLVQAAPFSDAPATARRLMRREQRVHVVEQLDAGAYGYLVSRTALLHPKGETFDVSMGLRGFFESQTKIAAQPDKDFGELVRQRRRKRGLPVAPAAKILPLLPDHSSENRDILKVVDIAAESLLQDEASADELSAARIRLAERRLVEALAALENATLRGASAREVARLEQWFADATAQYERLSQHMYRR